MSYYKIAGITVNLVLPEEYLHPNLSAYRVNGDINDANLTIRLQNDSCCQSTSLTPLVVSPYVNIYKPDENLYLYEYKEFSNTYKMMYYTNEHLAEIIASPSLPVAGNDLFYILRDAFLLVLQEYNTLVIHSSSIRYRNMAFLFSAPSGTGKTTHTTLWRTLYSTPILNGDIAACCIEDGIPIMYGLPWCGTSDDYLNVRERLGGIVFLSRGQKNEVTKLPHTESVMNIQSRSLSPNWTKNQCLDNWNTAQAISTLVPCFQLKCLPDSASVELIKSRLDNI